MLPSPVYSHTNMPARSILDLIQATILFKMDLNQNSKWNLFYYYYCFFINGKVFICQFLYTKTKCFSVGLTHYFRW